MQAAQAGAGAKAGDKTGKGAKADVSYITKRRIALRKTVNSIRWEIGMLIFVLFYFVVVFTTFALDDQKVYLATTPPPFCPLLRPIQLTRYRYTSQIARLICGDWITKSCKEDTLNVLDAAFYVIDVVFLTLFLLEISVKLLALGAYCQLAASLPPHALRWPRWGELLHKSAFLVAFPHCRHLTAMLHSRPQVARTSVIGSTSRTSLSS